MIMHNLGLVMRLIIHGKPTSWWDPPCLRILLTGAYSRSIILILIIPLTASSRLWIILISIGTLCMFRILKSTLRITWGRIWGSMLSEALILIIPLVDVPRWWVISRLTSAWPIRNTLILNIRAVLILRALAISLTRINISIIWITLIHLIMSLILRIRHIHLIIIRIILSLVIPVLSRTSKILVLRNPREVWGNLNIVWCCECC